MSENITSPPSPPPVIADKSMIASLFGMPIIRQMSKIRYAYQRKKTREEAPTSSIMTIPKSVMEMVGLRDGDRVFVSAYKDMFVVERVGDIMNAREEEDL